MQELLWLRLLFRLRVSVAVSGRVWTPVLLLQTKRISKTVGRQVTHNPDALGDQDEAAYSGTPIMQQRTAILKKDRGNGVRGVQSGDGA